jgi:hypothetical protein
MAGSVAFFMGDAYLKCVKNSAAHRDILKCSGISLVAISDASTHYGLLVMASFFGQGTFEVSRIQEKRPFNLIRKGFFQVGLRKIYMKINNLENSNDP